MLLEFSMDGIMSGPTAQILLAMIALFDQHGFYARVVSINNVLLHSTRGCRKNNQATINDLINAHSQINAPYLIDAPP